MSFLHDLFGVIPVSEFNSRLEALLRTNAALFRHNKHLTEQVRVLNDQIVRAKYRRKRRAVRCVKHWGSHDGYRGL